MSQTLAGDRGKKSEVFLGLGGNVGNVLENMAFALQVLDAKSSVCVTRVSSVYKTPPWGVTDQDWFLNCCAGLKTSLSPADLLEECLSIEAKLKRERVVRWGPRSVDIDILLFGDNHMDTETLKIPHPRMHERSFVMLPLAEIAPSLQVSGRSADDLSEEIHDPEIVKIDITADWWKSNSVID